MALNIPMPESPGTSLLQGLDTGSTLMTRMMQPILEREKLKQQQAQFVQNYALRKQAQDKANTLLPYMVQQYQDTHRTAANEAQMKSLYQNILKSALSGASVSPSPQGGGPGGVPGRIPSQINSGQPNPSEGAMAAQGAVPSQIGGQTNPAANITTNGQLAGDATTSSIEGQEHELRAGNPRLTKLDSIAGLVPGVPKPNTHISNGMVFTTYPSGRMTVQQMPGVQTPGEKSVSAREASKIRDSATALVNSANLVNQGYGLLDNNPDLTGLGSGLASTFNLSNNPDLGKFTTVAGNLQAELGKYASSRGGIQAVNWAARVKPSSWKPEDYNYGMFEGIQQKLQDDYHTLNQQYKAATGQDLPVPLPKMSRKESGGGTSKGKVIKWKMTNGQLVKE